MDSNLNDRLNDKLNKKIHIYIKSSQIFARVMYLLLPVSIYVKFYPATIIIIGYIIIDLYSIFKKDDYKGVLVRL